MTQNTSMQPLPAGAVLIRDPVAPEVTAWARQVLVTTPWGHVVGPKAFPAGNGADLLLVARVETHGNGTVTNPEPHPHPGVTVYAVPTGSLVVPVAPTVRRAHGVDVSSYQRPAGAGHEIRWDLVLGADYTFASVKCTEGLTNKNAYYAEELEGAKRLGLLVGAYHFFRTQTDPVEQARRLAREAVIEGVELELPLCLDVEDQSTKDPLGGLDPPTFAARVKVCLLELAQLGGRLPLVYISPGFAARFPDVGLGELAELWVAQWTGHDDAPSPTLPRGFTSWRLWQYSATAVVPGIGGGMDADVFNGTQDELVAWAAGAGDEPTGDVEAGRRILDVAGDVDAGVEGLDALDVPPPNGDGGDVPPAA